MLVVVLPIVMQLAAPRAVLARAQRDTAESPSVTLAGVGVADTTPRRRHAIVYSDWYAKRLTIHKIGAYASLPLYPAEYLLGDRLLKRGNEDSWVKPTHVAVASAIGGIFAINSITGLWNLWDSRQDPAGRTRRVVHALTMLGSDAGFLATAAVAGEAEDSGNSAQLHRNLAIGSMAVGAAGTVLMWLWKD